MVEILYASNNGTSTDFRLILSTKQVVVEVVKIVDVFSLFYYLVARIFQANIRRFKQKYNKPFFDASVTQ